MTAAIIGIIGTVLTAAIDLFNYLTKKEDPVKAAQEVAGAIHDAFEKAKESKGDTSAIEDSIANP